MISFRSIVFFMTLATVIAGSLSAMNQSYCSDLDLESYKKSIAYRDVLVCLKKQEAPYNFKNPNAYHYSLFPNLYNPLKKLCSVYGHDIGADLFREACKASGRILEDITESLAQHTLLFMAQYSLDVTKLLLKASDIPFEFVCKQNIIGETVVHIAALNGNLEMAKLLLDATASCEEAFHLISIKNNRGQTASQLARSEADNCRNREEKRKRLLAVETFIMNYICQTALHEAALNGQLEMVRQLLQDSDNAFEFVCMQNIIGQTALHVAVLNGQLAMVELLLSTASSCEEAFYLINLKNTNGQTASQLAKSEAEQCKNEETRKRLLAVDLYIRNYILNKFVANW